MEPYICITQLNDFLFCPRSIYFSNIYKENYNEDNYHKSWQKKGKIAHETIDEKKSTKKNILQSMSVYSDKYKIYGIIDTLNIDKKELIESKYNISKIYEGHRSQIYAQYFALKEMGYEITKLKIYSKKDNKSHKIELPTENDIKNFETLIEKMRNYNLNAPMKTNPKKCNNCIYNILCDYSE